MRRCHACGKILHELPYTCRRCGHIFCSDHHLPENHHCPGLRPHEHKPRHRYCGNCGKELYGLPFRCNRCGLILCDDCRLPENHGCVVTPAPPEPRPSKLTINKRPLVNAWKRFKIELTLKNFAIVSLVLMAIGFLPSIYPLENFGGLFSEFFTIGFWCFLFAYFLYAVKCWRADRTLQSILMIAIPYFGYSLATTKISESDPNILFYFFVVFCVCAILSTVVLYIGNKIKSVIDNHILKTPGKHRWYFRPDMSLSIVGIILITSLLIMAQPGSVFSENLNLVSKTITTSSDSIQTIQTSPALQPDSHANPAVTTTTNQPLRIETTIPPNYETGATTRMFDYVLRGQKGSISTTLYSGIYTQQKSGSKPAACIRYNYDSSPCTQEEIRLYYLKFLDEPIQKKGLDELIRKIKLRTSNQDDQARIAISLVQNIPYDYSQLYSLNSDMSYPYGVLYQNTGVCSEKSVLLAYLLRELGYSVVLFEFNSENHMAVGIQSPSQYSYRNSGYAFIEATTPSIVTDAEGDYVGAGKLTSIPKIFQISDGSSMTSISEEYSDARQYYQLYNQMNAMQDTYGMVLDEYHYALWQSMYGQWMSIVSKYGIEIISSDSSTRSYSFYSTNYPTYYPTVTPVQTLQYYYYD